MASQWHTGRLSAGAARSCRAPGGVLGTGGQGGNASEPADRYSDQSAARPTFYMPPSALHQCDRIAVPVVPDGRGASVHVRAGPEPEDDPDAALRALPVGVLNRPGAGSAVATLRDAANAGRELARWLSLAASRAHLVQLSHCGRWVVRPHTGRLSAGAGHSSTLACAARRSSAPAPPRFLASRLYSFPFLARFCRPVGPAVSLWVSPLAL